MSEPPSSPVPAAALPAAAGRAGGGAGRRLVDADPPCASYLTTALDGFLGENPANPDLRTDGRLFWHRAITIIRFPLQAAEILGTIWYMQSGT